MPSHHPVVALAAAIERLGAAINELIAPTAEEVGECDRIN